MIVTDEDVERGKTILNSLFEILKKDFNKKIEVEMKSLDSQIIASENEIKIKELDIQSKDIEKAKRRQEIAAVGNTLKISEEWSRSIVEELKSVKKRVEEIEGQQREMLKENVEGLSAISLLLYSSEIQQNLRYYNTLDEKLSDERVKQETLKLSIKSHEEDIKLLSTDIERLKKEIENLKNHINLLTQYKGRIDYAELIKEPTASLFPVSPKNLFNAVVAGLFGLAIFISLAFFLEFLEKQKTA
jgi:intracellular sulfur oxidation DsrE/DsrF family protein